MYTTAKVHGQQIQVVMIFSFDGISCHDTKD